MKRLSWSNGKTQFGRATTSSEAAFERNYLDTAQFLDVLAHSSELDRFFLRVAKKWSLKGLNKAVCWYWHLETGIYVVNLLLTIGLIG